MVWTPKRYNRLQFGKDYILLWVNIQNCTVNRYFLHGNQFHSNTLDQHQVYDIDQTPNILSHQNFRNEKQTVCYLHGYEESIRSESVSTVISAYIERNDHNILLIDWSPLASGNYFVDAVANLKQVKCTTE